jgi:hypothetical protein
MKELGVRKMNYVKLRSFYFDEYGSRAHNDTRKIFKGHVSGTGLSADTKKAPFTGAFRRIKFQMTAF